MRTKKEKNAWILYPYSKATRGNIPVKLTFEEQSLATLE
jgi:organic hydroperoxide reductase OsmC/OhrA